jgi:CrcB protein
MNLLAVFIGGGIGSAFRYGLGKIPFSYNFPINTFLANIIACFLLAVTIYFVRPQSSFWQTFVTIGICGGLSTFSTFSKETFELFQTGNYWIALSNIFISVLTCLGVFWMLHKV